MGTARAHHGRARPIGRIVRVQPGLDALGQPGRVAGQLSPGLPAERPVDVRVLEIALHGVQVLPLLAILARRTQPLERDRMRIVALGAAGYCAVVLAAVIHAVGVSFAGVAPLAIALGLGGVLTLAFAGFASVRPLRWRMLAS